MKTLKAAISGRPFCVTVCGKHSGLGTLASCCSQETGLLQAQSTLCGSTSQAADRGFFKIHFTGEKRGVALFSLCWLFAVAGQDHSCWETIFWSSGGSLAAWPELGKRRASFLKGSGCRLLSSFPRGCFEVLKAKPWSGRLCQYSHNRGLTDPARSRLKQALICF